MFPTSRPCTSVTAQVLKKIAKPPYAVKDVLYALCALSAGTGLLHKLELDEHGRILEFQLEFVGGCGV